MLPGRVLHHDAHEVEGNTLRRSWSLGQPALTGFSATWDPDAGSDAGPDWWGGIAWLIYGAFALIMLVGGRFLLAGRGD